MAEASVIIEFRTTSGRKVSPEDLVAAVRGADFTQAFGQVTEVLEDDHERRLLAAVSPEGAPHPPLAPATIEKKGHGLILREHDYLLESISDGSGRYAVRQYVDEGEEKTLKFGTTRPFAGVHQHGTARVPQRRFLGVSSDAKEKIKQILLGHVQRIVSQKLTGEG